MSEALAGLHRARCNKAHGLRGFAIKGRPDVRTRGGFLVCPATGLGQGQ